MHLSFWQLHMQTMVPWLPNYMHRDHDRGLSSSTGRVKFNSQIRMHSGRAVMEQEAWRLNLHMLG